MLLRRCFKTFVSGIGAQSKYYKNRYWYKENFRRYEAKPERIVSGSVCVRMHLTILNTQKLLINI